MRVWMLGRQGWCLVDVGWEMERLRSLYVENVVTRSLMACMQSQEEICVVRVLDAKICTRVFAYMTDPWRVVALKPLRDQRQMQMRG